MIDVSEIMVMGSIVSYLGLKKLVSRPGYIICIKPKQKSIVVLHVTVLGEKANLDM